MRQREVSQPMVPWPGGHLVHWCLSKCLTWLLPPQKGSTAGKVSWGPGAAVALRTAGRLAGEL